MRGKDRGDGVFYGEELVALPANVEGTGPFRYQWQINGEAVHGATNERATNELGDRPV